MALDLEEQEQVDKLKALWKKYGAYITRGVIAFFVLYKLDWATSHAKESATESIALIQLGQILVEEKNYEDALKKVNDVENEGYLGLSNDLKGDILNAMGKKEEAKKAYLEALKRFGPKDPYAKFTQEKLESLGV